MELREDTIMKIFRYLNTEVFHNYYNTDIKTVFSEDCTKPMFSDIIVWNQEKKRFVNGYELCLPNNFELSGAAQKIYMLMKERLSGYHRGGGAGNSG